LGTLAVITLLLLSSSPVHLGTLAVITDSTRRCSKGKAPGVSKLGISSTREVKGSPGDASQIR